MRASISRQTPRDRSRFSGIPASSEPCADGSADTRLEPLLLGGFRHCKENQPAPCAGLARGTRWAAVDPGGSNGINERAVRAARSAAPAPLAIARARVPVRLPFRFPFCPASTLSQGAFLQSLHVNCPNAITLSRDQIAPAIRFSRSNSHGTARSGRRVTFERKFSQIRPSNG